MTVLPLLLGGKEHAVHPSTPLLLREVNAGRGSGMVHGAVCLVFLFFFTALPLGRLPTVDGRTHLACEMTQQADDHRPRIVDMDRTYTDEKQAQALSV